MSNNKKSLQLDIGHSCNNHCIFCMEPRLANHPKTTPISFFEKILIENVGSFQRVVFTHKEPTLNAFLPSLIATSKRLGYPEIMLITNGRRLMYSDFADQLVLSGLNMLGISVHGQNARVHEASTRSPGSFEQTQGGLNNAKMLRKKNLLRSFTAHVTVTNLNYRHLTELYEFLYDFEPDRIVFNFFNPKCEAAKYSKMLMPRYTEVADELRRLLLKYPKPIFHTAAIPFCILPERRDLVGIMESGHIQLVEGLVPDSLSGMQKVEQCKDCAMNEHCAGVTHEYLEMYGSNEFITIKKQTSQRSVLNDGFVLTAKGLKPSHRGLVKNYELMRIEDEAIRHSLFFEKADFNLDIKVQKTVKMFDGDHSIYYVSNNKEMAKRLKNVENSIFTQNGLHESETREMGRLLGYPDCCIDFFIEHQDLSTAEMMFLSAKNTHIKAMALLNTIEGGQQISHIPCSLACKTSAKYALKAMDILGRDIANNRGFYILFQDGSYFKLADVGDRERKFELVKHSFYIGNDSILIEQKKHMLRTLDTAYEIVFADRQLIVYSNNNSPCIFTENGDFLFIDFY